MDRENLDKIFNIIERFNIKKVDWFSICQEYNQRNDNNIFGLILDKLELDKENYKEFFKFLEDNFLNIKFEDYKECFVILKFEYKELKGGE